MTTTLYAFAAMLGFALVLVVPLTLLNSRSIVQPVEHARQIAQAIAVGRPDAAASPSKAATKPARCWSR